MAVSELRKALTISSGGGSNLVPEDMEKAIRADLQVTSPLIGQLDTVAADGNVHTMVKRTARGGGAWFYGEMADVNYTNSTYGRRKLNCAYC